MTWGKLAIHIAAPVAIPAVLLLIFSSGSFLNRALQLVSLKSSESLIKQRLFWLSLMVPTCLFLSFGFICWQGYELSLTPSGVDTFLKISTLPLALLSSSIPLGVVVASFHSTQQTAEQIKSAAHKNSLDSYYAHRSEFFSHFSRHVPLKYFGVFEGKFQPHPLLYTNCTLGAPDSGTPSANMEFYEEIDSLFSSASKFLHMVINYEYDLTHATSYLFHVCTSIHQIADKLGLREIYLELAADSYQITIPPSSTHSKATQLVTLGTTSKEAIAAFRYARDFYISLCGFSGVKYGEIWQPFQYLTEGGQVFTKPGYGNVEKIFLNEIEQYRLDATIKVIKVSNIASM